MLAPLLFAINITSKGPITPCMFFHTTVMQMTPNCICLFRQDLKPLGGHVHMDAGHPGFPSQPIQLLQHWHQNGHLVSCSNQGCLKSRNRDWWATFSVATVSGSCRFALFNIRKTRPFVSKPGTQTLVEAMLITCVFSYLKQAHVVRLPNFTSVMLTYKVLAGWMTFSPFLWTYMFLYIMSW